MQSIRATITKGPEPDDWSPAKPPQGVGQRLRVGQGHSKGQADRKIHSDYVTRDKEDPSLGFSIH